MPAISETPQPWCELEEVRVVWSEIAEWLPMYKVRVLALLGTSPRLIAFSGSRGDGAIRIGINCQPPGPAQFLGQSVRPKCKDATP